MSTISSRLHAVTHELLRQRPRTLTLDKIAEDTGLTIYWLMHYSGNANCDPGVSKVETLYEYLTKTKLDLKLTA